MNERHFEVLEEMITDFNEYSTDYTKTRCKELEQVLIDTLNYITNLQEENQKLEKNYDRIYNENCKLRKQHNINDISLLDENQKLNKILDELEKWLKETKKFNYGFKIKSEYIYTYEFVCKNILNKLTELKNEVE